MRVPDEIRECVCFVEPNRSGGSIGIGSAFFVGVPLGIDDRIVVYAVTAKHCLGDDDGLADEVFLYLNAAAGRHPVKTDIADWLQHPSADVAVLAVGLDHSVYQYRVYPTESAATSDWIEERSIGPGDDVFVTGLLVHHPGVTRNMPIVRLGCIAALPDDPVVLKTGPDVVALVEARSIGGLSGSPVFVHLPFWRDTPGAGMVLASPGMTVAGSGGTHWLLGVMHGFYPVGRNDPDNVSGGDENLNTGIAVVVLADRILDLINRTDQVELREEAKKQIEESRQPTPTSVPVTDESSSE